MTEFKRDDFKIDKVAIWLFDLIKQNHNVGSHTEKNLINNQHVENFCEEATHYSEFISAERSIYISYNVSSWFKKPMGVQLRIDSIILYDDFIEFSKAKMKVLNSVEIGKTDNPNLN